MSTEDITVNFVSSTDDIVAEQNIQGATSIIDFHSAGHCLIIGGADEALELVEKLSPLKCTIVTVDSECAALSKQLTDAGIAVFSAPVLELEGYMGAFSATVKSEQQLTNLAVSVYAESGAFDLVLDLGSIPQLESELPPLGYFRGHNSDVLNAAMAAMPELVGDFEKPKYFNYNASICAHSRSELDGCHACISACATNAIRSNGEQVEVDPYLCQGCGSCATVCPSGAMTYAYPPPDNAIDRTRALLKDQKQSMLLLHTESDQEFLDTKNLPKQILPLLVEEVSAFGLDYWAAMVAGGVHRILLLISTDCTESTRSALDSQMGVFHQLLTGLGVSESVVQIVAHEAIDELDQLLEPIAALKNLKPSAFATHNNKRQTIRNAVDELAAQLQPVADIIPMDSPAPFGIIDVDKTKCTLCMACVSVCPAKALLDGQDTPALRMVEANCLQCGLCKGACPESAISLHSQYRVNSVEARKISTLNEEQPFECIRCQKPFATAKIIQSMFAKLDGHWMFKDDVAKRRLKMCEDCRVKDIFEHDEKGITVHKDAKDSAAENEEA